MSHLYFVTAVFALSFCKKRDTRACLAPSSVPLMQERSSDIQTQGRLAIPKGRGCQITGSSSGDMR